MAENIIAGLFGLTPQVIQQQQDKRSVDLGGLFAAATMNPYATPSVQNAYLKQQEAQFALGSMGARKLGGLFGIQDPELMKATAFESILAETQQELGPEGLQNPELLYGTLASKLANAGLQREATMITMEGQKVMANQRNQAPQNKLQQFISGYREAVSKGDEKAAKWYSDAITLETTPTEKGTGVPSTDKLRAQYLAIVNNPDSTPEEVLQAEQGLDRLAYEKRSGVLQQYTRNPETGTFEPISGTPVAEEIQQKEEKAIKSIYNQWKNSGNVLTNIKKAKELVGPWTTGWGGILSYLPKTDARRLSGLVQSIKANIGFDRLQEMRDSSPTGGALGQVAVQEINFLQSTIDTLDTLNSEEEVNDALEAVAASYIRLQNELESRFGEKTGGTLRGNQGSGSDSPAMSADDFLKSKGWN